MADNLINAEIDVEFTKIKAIRPQIIVTGTVEKPYYEILYYDTSDKTWHIGYSSYDLANVIKWKEECFEVVGKIEDMRPTADIVEVVYCKNCSWSTERTKDNELFQYQCRNTVACGKPRRACDFCSYGEKGER